MSGSGNGHGLDGVADAATFLARLVRFDPGALVRLRRAPAVGLTTLWARLPWSVLVSRTVPGTGPGDATVSAADLLAVLRSGGRTLPSRRDVAWRWPLPPAGGRTVETVPADELRRLAAAAAEALRAAVAGDRGRTVGQRVLRDVLLDHVAIVVTESAGHGGAAPGGRVEVPQRLVQAVVRMGFLGPTVDQTNDAYLSQDVQIRLISKWVGISAPYGMAWLRKVDDFGLNPGTAHPNG